MTDLKNILVNYWWAFVFAFILVMALMITIGNSKMNRRVADETEVLMRTTENEQEERFAVIEEKDLEGLPESVKKWLTSIGVIGQEKIQKVNLSQRGKMKLDPNQEKWIEPTAKQYIRVDKPGYLWYVDLPMIPMINTKGRDLFYEGEGSMVIRIGSVIPVVNVAGNHKINESSLHRFLLELPWYPTAALEDYMSWEEIDHLTARGILSYKGMQVEALFFFQEDGTLFRQEAQRYKENDEDAKRLPCIGEIKSHIMVEGLRIPSRTDVTWIIDGKPFTWYQLENYDIYFERG